MKRLSRPVKLVLLIALGILIAGSVGGSVARLDRDTITLTAQFDSAAGLYAGNPVAVLGMRIGKVARIAQKGGYVEVELTVDKSVRIPADARAVTVSDSVLTDRHIELTPVYKNGPVLGDHAVIGPDRTKTPVEFDSLLAMADKLSRALGGDGQGNGPIAGLVDTGAQVTGQHGDDIKSALDQLSQALRMGDDQGAATKNAITTIVRNLDTLSAAAADNDQKIRAFGTGVRQLSDLLADQNLGTGDTGAQLLQILTQTTDLMHRNRAALVASASGADTVTKSLADYNRNIAEFMDVFPMLTTNAYNAIDPVTHMGRVHVNPDKMILDGQMVKEVCNLLNMKQLGCNTGKLSDMGPDFGVVAMLAGIAGLPK